MNWEIVIRLIGNIFMRMQSAERRSSEDQCRNEEQEGEAGKKVSAGESAKIETVKYLLVCQRPHVRASWCPRAATVIRAQNLLS